MSVFCKQGDGYDLDLDSDDDDGVCIGGQDSSDDDDEFEGDISLRSLKEACNFAPRRRNLSTESDDFERELNDELDQTVAALEHGRFSDTSQACEDSTDTNTGPPPAPDQAVVQEQTFYDDEYYDSDDADGLPTEVKKKKQPILSNDDLLYDPDMDDDDQKWMDEQRNRRRPTGKGTKGKKTPVSDAILDCPACLTTVCIDCQRHELYHSQFRAMFVQNCTVDSSQTITVPLQDTKRKRKHDRAPEKTEVSVSQNGEDNFLAVKCAECHTVVGTLDKEEIYHFYNVVPSHC